MPTLTIGTGRCRCAARGPNSGGVGGFDAHQRRDRVDIVCLDPAALGMVGRSGWWVREVPRINNGVGRDGANGPGAGAEVVGDG